MFSTFDKLAFGSEIAGRCIGRTTREGLNFLMARMPLVPVQ